MEEDNNPAPEAENTENQENSESVSEETESKKRTPIVPGEVIVSGEDYLPSDGTKRVGEDIIATRFGLAEEAGRVIRVISIFGAFIPRKNNVVIGTVTEITHSGWLVDIGAASNAFLPIEESPRFIHRNEMDQFLAVGDTISAKIWSVKSRGIDLSLKGRGLGKLENGYIFSIISSRVPRVIGREGSMIGLIKEKTGCSITVGQNGKVWIRGDSLEAEIKARKAVEFVSEKVHVGGLTDKMEAWFTEE